MLEALDDRRLALLLALYAFGVAVWPVAASLETTFDDGYYYLEIARHLANGDGSTFDGLHSTNGYQPLWLLILVPLMRLASDAATALLLANFLQAVLSVVAAVLVYRTARFGLGRLGGTLATLLWIDLTHRLWLSGLEFSAHAVCLLATIYLYLSRHAGRRPGTFADCLALGLCCALTFLARIDTVLLAPLLAWALWRRGGYQRLVAFSAPMAVACGAYFAANLSFFGHLLPVSGAVKRSWSEILQSVDPVYLSHGWLAAKALNLASPLIELVTAGEGRSLGLGVTCALIWILAMLIKKNGLGGGEGWKTWSFQPRQMAPWAIFGLLQVLVYGIYFHGSMSYRPWYFVCQPWLGAVWVATAFEWLRRWSMSYRSSEQNRQWISIGAVAVCCLVAAHTVRGLSIWSQQPRSSAFRASAAWAASHLPPDAVIGTWNAGTLGYWSNRRVVNLDGLVNSWEFFEHGRHDLCRYWSETGITHVIDAFQRGEFLTLMPTHPSYRHCVDRLELMTEEIQDGGAWSIRAYRFHGAPTLSDSSLEIAPRRNR